LVRRILTLSIDFGVGEDFHQLRRRHHHRLFLPAHGDGDVVTIVGVDGRFTSIHIPTSGL